MNVPLEKEPSSLECRMVEVTTGFMELIVALRLEEAIAWYD
jgi:hypothetical protein